MTRAWALIIGRIWFETLRELLSLFFFSFFVCALMREERHCNWDSWGTSFESKRALQTLIFLVLYSLYVDLWVLNCCFTYSFGSKKLIFKLRLINYWIDKNYIYDKLITYIDNWKKFRLVTVAHIHLDFIL